ncbi:signal recognition particle 19kDa [Tritrichomonas musculus]|uniref:Signal recognition particle 19kDa n=1 Tax=Tritrichomonas musculus TaxID=1915356 RepID=A0ABR2LC16_9EUKA
MKPQTPPHALSHDHVIVYPVYIDAAAGQFDGRKISKEDAIENPNPKAMLTAAKALGFEVELQEGLRHPRDFWRFGRLSVKFFNGQEKDKKPINPDINTRRKLFREIAKKMKEIGNAAPKATTGKKTREERLQQKRQKK